MGLLRQPVWAQGRQRQESSVLSGTEFNLRIGETDVNITGRSRTALTINDSMPGPLLRWKEGDTITLNVANALDDQRDYVWARARRCVRPAGLGPLGEVRRAHRSDARQLPVDELGVRAGCTAGTGPHARPAAARPAADGEQAYAAGAGRRCPTGRPRDAGVASQDLQEGVRAFTAKRSPAWQGR
jgi:FtsP/CotA-like multicopper oxidase with cupredoxin domain